MSDKIVNILVAGVGGQGVMTAAEILSQAALEQGHDVKKTEVAGMSQRGGVVTSHVRFGERVLSPAIPDGEADILLGFEPAESLRWCEQLRPDGIALINNLPQTPPVVTLGLYDYPDDPVAQMAERGITMHAFPASGIAHDLGNLKLVNTVMLGAVAKYLPFPETVLKELILSRFQQKKPELVEVNAKAFDAGHSSHERML